jgi:nitrate reductase molybdenum cofactor assembly chaperone NarJ/NarW
MNKAAAALPLPADQEHAGHFKMIKMGWGLYPSLNRKQGEMMSDDTRQVFQLCSYLLNYPDHEWIDSLIEVEEEVEYLASSPMKDELLQFCQGAKKKSAAAILSTYVNTFDFGKKTNLYVTYMSSGEQRERGMDLLFLKNYYKLQGFSVTDKELPDYLPIMLEFASLVDEEKIKPVFERYFENIKEIEKHLIDANNLYHHILSACLRALEDAGVTKAVRRSEEICSTSFYG